ncbi:MAG: hypothetical protein QM648_03425 [Solirubrobacterales bacterium]
MHPTKHFRLIAVLALALAGMALVASQAVAGGHHRDRQARLDSDHDGASNRCEIQASLDRTSTDSDSNGTIDGLEDSDGDGANNAAESKLRTNCGVANKRFRIGAATVKSYSAEDGLVLAIGKRGLISGAVSSKLVCEQDDTSDDDSSDDSTTAQVASRHRGEGEAGDDRGGEGRGGGGDDRGGPDDRGASGEAGDDRGGHGEDDDDDTVACTTADLTEGASVLAAKYKKGSFTRIHLASADEGDF